MLGYGGTTVYTVLCALINNYIFAQYTKMCYQEQNGNDVINFLSFRLKWYSEIVFIFPKIIFRKVNDVKENVEVLYFEKTISWKYSILKRQYFEKKIFQIENISKRQYFEMAIFRKPYHNQVMLT